MANEVDTTDTMWVYDLPIDPDTVAQVDWRGDRVLRIHRISQVAHRVGNFLLELAASTPPMM